MPKYTINGTKKKPSSRPSRWVFSGYNKTRLGYGFAFCGDEAEAYKNTLKNSHFEWIRLVTKLVGHQIRDHFLLTFNAISQAA